MQKYDIVALGGTFDIIHDGHMKLLSKAFSISNKAIIGLTSDELAAKKGKFKINKSVGKILKLEKKFLNWNTFNNFKKNVVNSKINLYSMLKKLKNNNKKIYGIGAPSRASTLINYVGLDENIIDCVLEIEGSYKIGNYIPGKKIPILSEKKLYEDPPDFVILFSWHIASELKSNLKKRGFKGKFIITFPYPRMES